MVNYPTGDFLIRLKNAALAYKKEISYPATKLVIAVAKVLEKENMLVDVEVKDGILTTKLAYKSKKPVLMDVRLVSKLGLRIYQSTDEIRKHRGASFYIISTSKGVISSKEVGKVGASGEVIAEIW